MFLVLSVPVKAETLPEPLTANDFPVFDPKKVKLGQLLFYDPILSGNRNISCGICHSPEFGTSDGFSLGVGEGGVGVGPTRTAGTGEDRIRKRIPRNSPGLWNLAAHEVKVLFHDGRLSVSDIYQNGFNSPAQEWLPEGFESILAAQAVFPLTSQFEMAGNPKENEVIGARHDRIDYVWPILAKRVRIIPEYGDMFVEAFDHINHASEVTIVEIGNALGQFMGFEWQSFDSPFDAWLAGDKTALTLEQKRGLDVFFGKGGCAQCHAGKLFTDHKFHALALPHIGPGRTREFDPVVRDVGLMGESDRLEDAYRFRTPSLRNVELTAPYGHNGTYKTLEGIIRHHLDPLGSLEVWDKSQITLASAKWLEAIDFVSMQDVFERKRLSSKVDIEPKNLAAQEIDDLIAFLNGLTGTRSIEGRLGKPTQVPSGLKVE